MYRHGEFNAAVGGLAALPPEEAYRAARSVVRQSLRPFRRDALQAVLALHTEVGLPKHLTMCGDLTALSRGTYGGAEHPLLRLDFPSFEHGLLETLKSQFPDDEFLRTWYVTVMAHSDLGFGWDGCYDNAPPRIRAHPEMQLALGTAHEKNWQQEQADGWRLPHFAPKLEEAEQAFRAALQGTPDMHEARLRLGHVLLLEGKPDEALVTFREVRRHLDRGFDYVEQLLEGRAHEQRGDLDRAAEAYRAARAMKPRAQSAVMALAQLAYSRGRRAEALEHVLELPGTTTAGLQAQPWVWYAEGADPWSWYYFGTAWRFPTYLARLRAMVQEK
jgi:tetratricopeptide (TPR) repeat protein